MSTEKSELSDKWIEIEDETPSEALKYYLVTHEVSEHYDDLVTDRYYLDAQTGINGERAYYWRYSENGGKVIRGYDKPVHWMEEPEPPQKKASDNGQD